LVTEARTKLSKEQVQFYNENGYLCPLSVLSEAETAEFRRHFDEYTQRNQARLSKLDPRERRAVYGYTHLVLPWVYQIVSHPKVLDAVEGAIGPNILVWESAWFAKFPRDAAFISWHQDGAYWGLQPPTVTTAWIALSASTPENGCMQVMPGSQNLKLQQRDTFAKNNLLSRGQEIVFDAAGRNAVSLILTPGQMSLHHIGIAHGSEPNTSDYPRIGIAVRYIAPEVVQNGSERQMVQLVRGKDEYGHFDIVAPPADEFSSAAVLQEANRRLLENLAPDRAPANHVPNKTA
jgi:non-haem Fe2+, alpha-ketoglutarate-dependent halogenase